MTEMNEWMRAERSERALAVFIPFYNNKGSFLQGLILFLFLHCCVICTIKVVVEFIQGENDEPNMKI